MIDDPVLWKGSVLYVFVARREGILQRKPKNFPVEAPVFDASTH